MLFKLKNDERLNLSFPEQPNEKAEQILKCYRVGTYLLRTDPSCDQYLSGIHSDGKVHHVRLQISSDSLIGFNGDPGLKMIYKASTIAELAPIALHCDPDQCHLITFQEIRCP